MLGRPVVLRWTGRLASESLTTDTLRRTVWHMLALSVDGAKHLAIAIIVGFIVLSVVSAAAISNITTKIVAMLVFAGFALGVWTQRTNLVDCADRARDKVAVGDASDTACTFFGATITVPGVDVPGGDDTGA